MIKAFVTHGMYVSIYASIVVQMNSLGANCCYVRRAVTTYNKQGCCV